MIDNHGGARGLTFWGAAPRTPPWLLPRAIGKVWRHTWPYRNMVTQWDFMGKSWDITLAISWSDDSNGIWTWNWWFHDAKKALLMIRRGYTSQYIEDSQIQYDDKDLLTDWWWDITWLTHKGFVVSAWHVRSPNMGDIWWQVHDLVGNIMGISHLQTKN